MLSELDFRDVFANVSSQTTESKVSVKISTDASSKMIGSFTDQFLKASNLPDDTAIGTLSKRSQFAYLIGLALFVKEQGYSNAVIEQVIGRVSRIPKGKFPTIMGKAKTLFTLRKCKEYDLRIDRMAKRQAGAIKALRDGEHTTKYKRGGVAHWPTILDLDGCGSATAFIIHVRETYGVPQYDANGKITNWPAGIDEQVSKAIETRRNAELSWVEIGKQVVIDVSKVFGSRGRQAEWSVELDPLLCVASAYQHIELDDEDDDEE